VRQVPQESLRRSFAITRRTGQRRAPEQPDVAHGLHNLEGTRPHKASARSLAQPEAAPAPGGRHIEKCVGTANPDAAELDVPPWPSVAEVRETVTSTGPAMSAGQEGVQRPATVSPASLSPAAQATAATWRPTGAPLSIMPTGGARTPQPGPGAPSSGGQVDRAPRKALICDSSARVTSTTASVSQRLVRDHDRSPRAFTPAEPALTRIRRIDRPVADQTPIN
jgi:hypothetical protein